MNKIVFYLKELYYIILYYIILYYIILYYIILYYIILYYFSLIAYIYAYMRQIFSTKDKKKNNVVFTLLFLNRNNFGHHPGYFDS